MEGHNEEADESNDAPERNTRPSALSSRGTNTANVHAEHRPIHELEHNVRATDVSGGNPGFPLSLPDSVLSPTTPTTLEGVSSLAKATLRTSVQRSQGIPTESVHANENQQSTPVTPAAVPVECQEQTPSQRSSKSPNRSNDGLPIRRSKRTSVQPRDWWANPFGTERRRLEKSVISNPSPQPFDLPPDGKDSLPRRLEFATPRTAKRESQPSFSTQRPRKKTTVLLPGPSSAVDVTSPRPPISNKGVTHPQSAPRKPQKRNRLYPENSTAGTEQAIYKSGNVSTPAPLPAPGSSAPSLSVPRSVYINAPIDEEYGDKEEISVRHDAPSRSPPAVARSVNLRFHALPVSNGFVQVATAVTVNSSFIGELRIPGHTSTGPRRADEGDEIFFVLSGILQCDVEFTRISIRDGDYIAIPHMASYVFLNQFGVGCRLLFFAPRNPFA